MLAWYDGMNARYDSTTYQVLYTEFSVICTSLLEMFIIAIY